MEKKFMSAGNGEQLIVCPCNHCSRLLEFDALCVGDVADCPHCGSETTLFRPQVELHAGGSEVSPEVERSSLGGAVDFEEALQRRSTATGTRTERLGRKLGKTLAPHITPILPHAEAPVQAAPNLPLSPILALLGSGLMLVGSFLPVFSIPMRGSITYFNNGQGDGMLMVILALVVFAVAVSRRPRWFWLYGTLGGAMLAYDARNFVVFTETAKQEVKLSMEGNPFGGFVTAAAEGMQLEYGVAVMAVGILMVFAAGSVRPGTLRA